MSWSSSPIPAQRLSESTRATAPVIGGVLVVALTVLLATVIGTAMLGAGSPSAPPEPAPTTAVGLSVDIDDGSVEVRGPLLDVGGLGKPVSGTGSDRVTEDCSPE